MKAKRLVDGQMVNPFYNANDARNAKAAGLPYDISPYLTLPAGEIVDDPECWMLCVGKDAVMQPVDDECAAKVLAVMSAPERQTFLRQLRQLNQPEVRKQQGKKQLEWLDAMLDVYGDEIDVLDKTAPVKPAAKPAAKPPETPAS